MNDSYLTISSASEGLYKEKGSKFYAFAFPIKNEEEFQHHLLDLKKVHFNARHFCYAYKLGLTENNYRYNDDGEPRNSAGTPIYGQILSTNITDVGIIVVRYFGGTKLGVGGLVSAYRNAAKDALNNATVIEKFVQVVYILNFNYEFMSEIMQFIKQQHILIIEQVFDSICSLKISIRQKNAAQLEKELNKMGKLKMEFEKFLN